MDDDVPNITFDKVFPTSYPFVFSNAIIPKDKLSLTNSPWFVSKNSSCTFYTFYIQTLYYKIHVSDDDETLHLYCIEHNPAFYFTALTTQRHFVHYFYVYMYLYCWGAIRLNVRVIVILCWLKSKFCVQVYRWSNILTSKCMSKFLKSVSSEEYCLFNIMSLHAVLKSILFGGIARLCLVTRIKLSHKSYS